MIDEGLLARLRQAADAIAEQQGNSLGDDPATFDEWMLLRDAAALAARDDAAPTDAECVEVANRAQARRGISIFPETARAVIEAWREVRP